MDTIKEKASFLEAFGRTSEERVHNALQQLRKGKGILLVDDENRENEGDLVFPANQMTVNDMALMIRECSGIVCLCLPHEKADTLNLPLMVKDNTSLFETPFTVSIEALRGVTTGLSASDRITTIRTACCENAVAEDLVKPGHIFPLRAADNGVFSRNGHTEGSVDLMRLAGLEPYAVLCELMNTDGTMARMPHITDFARHHHLAVLTIEDIIYYRKFVRDYEKI